MKKYEAICIFHPSTSSEKVEEIISKIDAKIKDASGTVDKVDKLGNKRLAYQFQKARNVESAIYVFIYFSGHGEVPGKLNAYLKYVEELIRYSILVSQVSKAEKVEVELPGAEVEEAPKA